MLNGAKLENLDLSTIEIRKLSHEQWQEVKDEIVRRARDERRKALILLIPKLGSWWRDLRVERTRSSADLL